MYGRGRRGLLAGGIPITHPKEKRETMKKIFSILTLTCVLASMMAFAQDTTKKDDTMKSDSTKKTASASKTSTAKSKTASKKTTTTKKDDSMKKSDDSKKPQ